MSRSSQQKRIHYVRAVYNKGTKPKQTFQQLITAALGILSTVADTEIALPNGVTLEVRHRDVAVSGGLTLAIGLGVPGEAMGTMGLKAKQAQDTDQPIQPTQGRAFKLADGFCQIEDDDLLVCNDGSMRIELLDAYFRALMNKANLTPLDQAFTLVRRMDKSKQKTLDAEGVKAFEVNTAAYAAGEELETGSEIAQGLWSFLAGLRSALSSGLSTEKEQDVLAEHWGDVNVRTVITVKGGVRSEPIVLKSIEESAQELQNESPEGTDVTLITRKNNRVNLRDLSLSTVKSVKRLQGQNGLDHYDAWKKLEEYRQELSSTRRWKK